MKHMYFLAWLSLLLGWTTTTAQAQTIYEAETTTTNGEIFYNYPGATGGGIVGNLYAGRYVSFTVRVAQAGHYSAILRYATGFTVDQKLAVEVNGSFNQPAVFAPTGTWDGWRPHTVVLALRAGINTITYRASSPENGLSTSII